MPNLLDVPYSSQLAHGYCLPACAQMALAYLGIEHSQEALARTLDIIENFGVPASHLLKLRSRDVFVVYETEGSIQILDHWLKEQTPVITFVRTNLLAYWQGQVAQHAVLVVGLEDPYIYLLDPAKTSDVIPVHVDEFLLAWDEMEFSYAVIARR